MNELGRKYHVLIIEDPTFRKTVTLEEATYSMGRHSSNDIVLSSQKVSRNHATLLRRTDVKTNNFSYWILDGDLQGNRSRNGIFINAKKCLVHELKNGDIIKFSGDLKATYQIVNDEQAISNYSSRRDYQSSVSDSSEDQRKRTVFNKETVYNKETLLNKETVVAPYEELRNNNNSELIRLTSVAELSSQSIFEIDLQHNITYINSAALMSFNDISRVRSQHPLIMDLIEKCTSENNTFRREVQIGDRYFQQNAHYLPENKIIRSYITEITDQKTLAQELSFRKSIYNTIIQKNTDGILVVNYDDKKILESNTVANQILGYSTKELNSKLIDELSFENQKISSLLQESLVKTQNYVKDCLICAKDGSAINLKLDISLISNGTEKQFLIFLREHNQNSGIKLQDKIVSLPKLKGFQEQLNKAIANAQRNHKLLAVMSVKINEASGVYHNFNEDLKLLFVSSFSERLKACLRSGDTIAYWEENKFVILMPQITAVEEAAKISGRILDSLVQNFKIGEHQLTIYAQIGIAIYPQDGDKSELLLKNADLALYRTHQNNDFGYHFYNENMNSQVLVQLKLEHFLNHALEKEEFVLYYQPQVNVQSGEILGIEALLRWQHPELGLVSPASFIKIAEQTGLIIPIGEWVLRTACRQNKLWHSQGLPPVKISVNISPLQFQQANFPLIVEQILTETNLEPHLLELEINSSNVMQNIDYACGTLSQLQEIGIHISISDFATGFASLERLKKIPFDTLKIDRDFIKQLTDNPQDLAIVSAMVILGKGFNLRIIAEGVETEEQIELLRSQECIQMQGFWFSRPLAAEEATRLLPFNYTNENGEVAKYNEKIND